ncbi:MAG: DUF3306 domain-containing protein [Limnohabitans sp.]
MANDDGFLSRWSRRKADVRQGKPLDEPVLPIPAAPVRGSEPARSVTTPTANAAAAHEPGNKPSLTLDDVQQLTPESDYADFMARGVAPDVKNAAMKKLFTDPHFNVMDRMDVYIDDYTQPDPLPAAMLRQMASAQFLNLFDDEGDKPAAENVAQSVPAVDLPSNPEPATHDHADLRLQPNPTSRPEGTGPKPV